LTPASFLLRAGDDNVTGTVSLNPAGTIATFSPSAPLANGTGRVRIYSFYYQALGLDPFPCKLTNMNFPEIHADKFYGDRSNGSFRGGKKKAFQRKGKPWIKK
jgi:hypothetical protein